MILAIKQGGEWVLSPAGMGIPVGMVAELKHWEDCGIIP